jgi:murein DD-endopeptidase MepM/ murein hydrolase activator NlpD
MSKKIRFNPETLNYEPVKKTGQIKLKSIIWILLSAIAFGFVIILITTYFFPTGQEKQLKKELSILEKNYRDLNQKLDKSVQQYQQLYDKEQEISKLTFDTENEDLISLIEELQSLSPDFNFKTLLDSTNQKISNSSEISIELIRKIKILLDLAYSKQVFANNVPAILPIEKGNFVLISGMGERIHPIFKTLRPHSGVDLAARQGTAVVATGNGIVIRPPASLEGLGNIVAIDHGFGYISIYAALLKSDVRPGNRVVRGQTIGSVGRSGITSGPHLHYEVWKNNKAVNPVNYFFLSINPLEFKEFQRKAAVRNQSMS